MVTTKVVSKFMAHGVVSQSTSLLLGSYSISSPGILKKFVFEKYRHDKNYSLIAI